jgi:peptide/nickel transport system ATP-binding protein
MSQPILELRNATKIYGKSGGLLGGDGREVVALEDFNMTIHEKPATITTIAGESGSGKTTLAKLILNFEKTTSGQVLYQGQDVATMNRQQIREYRRNVQAVFQDPFAVYNPFYRVQHVFDLAIKHFRLTRSRKEALDMIEESLNEVGMRGEEVLRKYPHQLSGGQRQRIMMARAYLIKPRLIIADEPVSMVDASLRASILDVMMRLKDYHGISFLYITHDLSTAYQIGDQICILYQGTIAERGLTTKVIDRPQHPYVQLLVDSVPVPDPATKWQDMIELPVEEEMRVTVATGCRFYSRCPHRMDRCLEKHPPLYKIDDVDHQAACYLYDEKEVAEVS